MERPVLLSQVCLLRDETLSLAGVTLSLRHVADERVYTQLQLLVARVRSLQLPLQLVRTRSLLALTLQLALRTVGTLGTLRLLPLLRLGRLRGVRREVLREVVCSLRRGGGERAVVRKAPAQVDVLGVGRYLQRVR